MLAGTWLDERIAEAASERERRGGRAGGIPRAMASAAAFVAAALVLLLVARDLVLAPGGSARFLQLMTYRYDRRWPSTEAFAPALGAVAIAAALACAALSVRAWRVRAAVAFGGCAMVFSVLLLDGYLVVAAPDGGQRGVFEAFYRSRGAGDQSAPLVAYQLNWKGENFYSGNHLAIFISSGTPLRTYLEARKKSGQATVYFVTERGRVGGLRGELGAVRSFAEVTDRSVSHEFSLVRAEL